MIGNYIVNSKELSRRLSEEIFWIGFFTLITGYFLSSTLITSFLLPGNSVNYIIWFSIILFVIKLLIQNEFTPKLILLTLVGTFIGGLVYKYSSDKTFLAMILGITAANNIKFSEILRNYLKIVIPFTLVTILLSVFNFIPNLTYSRGGGGVRNSMGFIYPTDFAAHISFIFLAISILYRKIYSKTRVLFGISLAYFVHKVCYADLDTIILVVTSISFYILPKIEHKIEKSRVVWLLVMIFPLCYYISYETSKMFSYSNPLLIQVNHFFSNRLYFGNLALNSYPVKLFGQVIPMRGNGGLDGYKQIASIYNYFFIDSSFLRLLLMSGTVGLIFVGLIYILVSIRVVKDRDMYLGVALILICIHSIVAQFIIHPGYNFILFYLFSYKDLNNYKTKNYFL